MTKDKEKKVKLLKKLIKKKLMNQFYKIETEFNNEQCGSR